MVLFHYSVTAIGILPGQGQVKIYLCLNGVLIYFMCGWPGPNCTSFSSLMGRGDWSVPSVIISLLTPIIPQPLCLGTLQEICYFCQAIHCPVVSIISWSAGHLSGHLLALVSHFWPLCFYFWSWIGRDNEFCISDTAINLPTITGNDPRPTRHSDYSSAL